MGMGGHCDGVLSLASSLSLHDGRFYSSGSIYLNRRFYTWKYAGEGFTSIQNRFPSLLFVMLSLRSLGRFKRFYLVKNFLFARRCWVFISLILVAKKPFLLSQRVVFNLVFWDRW
jgi:hypothetical protein